MHCKTDFLLKENGQLALALCKTFKTLLTWRGRGEREYQRTLRKKNPNQPLRIGEKALRQIGIFKLKVQSTEEEPEPATQNRRKSAATDWHL